MKLYEITKQLHTTLQATAKKLGKEITLTNTGYYLVKYLWMDTEGKIYWKYERLSSLEMSKVIKYHEVSVIEAPQIRQILKVFEVELGRNKSYVLVHENNEGVEYYYYNRIDQIEEQEGELGYRRIIAFTHRLKIQALCHKWLDGLNPMIDTDPFAVLTELKIILKIKP